MSKDKIEALASAMPGTTAWTVAIFKAEDVPVGTTVIPALQVVADERTAFGAWWADFADSHPEWPFADSGALRWEAYQAGRAAAPVQAQEPVVLPIKKWTERYVSEAFSVKDRPAAIRQAMEMEIGDLRAAPTQERHSDDTAWDKFVEAAKAKMAEKRAEGRGGWDDPTQCNVQDLATLLVELVERGDPVNIANVCMMIWNRAQSGYPLGSFDIITASINRAPVRPVAVPDGWKLVPIAPTTQIEDTIKDIGTSSGEGWNANDSREYWEMLLGACPAAPAAQDEALKPECCGSTEFCERAEKAEKQWDSWMACANHWQGRAEKAEACVSHLPEKMTPEMREAMWEAITKHGLSNLEYWIEELYNDIRKAVIKQALGI